MAANYIVTALVCVAIVLALLFSLLFIITFARRKRLRTAATLPVNLLLLNLAVIDVIAVVCWTGLSAISAALGRWPLPDEICRMQVWFMGFCNLNCTHTLCLLMFERFLKVVKPSKHREIFFDIIVVIMLSAIWVFDAVMATFPVWGWGTTKYFADQYQCAIDDELSVSHMNFATTMHFGIPGVLSIIFYIVTCVRLHQVKKSLLPGAVIVLETGQGTVAGDTYADRLQRQYDTFKITADDKRQTAKIQKKDTIPDDGYKSDSDAGSSDSDAPDNSGNDVDVVKAGRQPRRFHYLSRDDFVLVHVSALMCLLYYVCWLLYIVWSYIWVYYVHVSMPAGLLTAAVVCSHFGSAVHVLALLVHPKYRAVVIKTLRPTRAVTTVKVNTSRQTAT